MATASMRAAAAPVSGNTCTETPEKLCAIAAGYKKSTGRLLPITWDFSHLSLETTYDTFSIKLFELMGYTGFIWSPEGTGVLLLTRMAVIESVRRYDAIRS